MTFLYWCVFSPVCLTDAITELTLRSRFPIAFTLALSDIIWHQRSGMIKLLVHRSANLLPCIECHRIYQYICSEAQYRGHEDFAWMALFGTICP